DNGDGLGQHIDPRAEQVSDIQREGRAVAGVVLHLRGRAWNGTARERPRLGEQRLHRHEVQAGLLPAGQYCARQNSDVCARFGDARRSRGLGEDQERVPAR
ncbi:unnamed protein product, partial [Prorocentrum cordatum]